MSSAADVELALDCQVMRVWVLKPAFFPERVRTGRFAAIPEIFELSSEDKKDAELQGAEPMLSVFDRSRTSVSEAKNLRRIDAPNDDFAGFSLTVETIQQVASQYIPHRRVRVQRDPYTDERATEPGGDGHCGILETDRRDGEARQSYKAFRTELARRCTIVRVSEDT
jgi:hypothetical protein